MITFAKGVTGAYVPLGGVLIAENIAAFYEDSPLNAGHTYSGHPLAMAAAMGAMDAFEAGGHFKSAYAIEGWLVEGLEAIRSRHPIVGDVRGIGAFFAIELVKDRTTRQPVAPWQAPLPSEMAAFASELLESGLWLYAKHNILIFAPPLVCTKEDIETNLEIFEHILLRHEFALIA
jgi:taurine--2-oxoglutarate transaminase